MIAACDPWPPTCPERARVQIDKDGWREPGQDPNLDVFTVTASEAWRVEVTSANGWMAVEVPPSPRGDAIDLPDVGEVVAVRFNDNDDGDRYATVADTAGVVLLDAGGSAPVRMAGRLHYLGGDRAPGGTCEDDYGFYRSPTLVNVVDDVMDVVGATGDVVDVTIDGMDYLGVIVNAQYLDCVDATDCGGRVDQAYVARPRR